MPKVSAIAEADAEKLYPLAVPFGNNGTSVTLNIKYRTPTTDRVMQLSAAARCAALIAERDLVDEKDQPIAPTLEYLNGLPIPFVTKIQEAIDADFFPGKAK